MGNAKKHKAKRLSKHYMTRSRERFGKTKNQARVSSERALNFGLQLHNTRGELYERLRSCSYPTDGTFKKIYPNVIYYANSIYVFRQSCLVTVMPIDTKYENELYKYTTYVRFHNYKVARSRYKSEDEKKKLSAILETGKRYMLYELNTILAEYHVVGVGIKLVTEHKAYILVSGDITAIPDEVVKNIKKTLDVILVDKSSQEIVESTDTTNTTKNSVDVTHKDTNITHDQEELRCLYKRWFVSNARCAVKIYYVDNDYVILKAKDEYFSKNITPEHLKEFEKTFNTKVFLREPCDCISGRRISLTPKNIHLLTAMSNWLRNEFVNRVIILSLTEDTVEVMCYPKLTEDIKHRFETEFDYKLKKGKW